jgi:hypothetical protein
VSKLTGPTTAGKPTQSVVEKAAESIFDDLDALRRAQAATEGQIESGAETTNATNCPSNDHQRDAYSSFPLGCSLSTGDVGCRAEPVAPPKAPQHRYFRVPYPWWQSATRLPGAAPLVGALLWESLKPTWREPRMRSPQCLAPLRLHPRTIRRALVALSQARLIELTRPTHQAYAIRLTGPSRLVGGFIPPTSVMYLARVARVAGTSSAVLWVSLRRYAHLARGGSIYFGVRRGRAIGFSKHRTSRALLALECAGLISRRGISITMRAAATPPPNRR